MINDFHGAVLLPSDEGYTDSANTHYAQGSPKLVARPSSAADVAAAVRYAAAEGLDASIRAGGHGTSGVSTNEGGLVIDLTPLDTVEVVDAAANRVRIGGGAVWGHVADELAKHGLALTSGDTASVGVGGLTLGGGIGWVVRAWGLALDSLVEAEVVLADGTIVTANETEHADLFWRCAAAVATSASSRRSRSRRTRSRVSCTARSPSSSSMSPRCCAAGATRCAPRRASSTPSSCRCRRSVPRCRPRCRSRCAGRAPTSRRRRPPLAPLLALPGHQGAHARGVHLSGPARREPRPASWHQDRRPQRVHRRADRCPGGCAGRSSRVQRGSAEPSQPRWCVLRGRCRRNRVRLAPERSARDRGGVPAAGNAGWHRGADPRRIRGDRRLAGCLRQLHGRADAAERIYLAETLERLRAIKRELDPTGLLRGNQPISV